MIITKKYLVLLVFFSFCKPFLTGKQQHIESVLNQIEKDHKVKIKKKEVILLDDDEKNISVARSCKMQALLIKGDDSLDELLEQR